MISMPWRPRLPCMSGDLCGCEGRRGALPLDPAKGRRPLEPLYRGFGEEGAAIWLPRPRLPPPPQIP
jgi:hypothetical protein